MKTTLTRRRCLTVLTTSITALLGGGVQAQISLGTASGTIVQNFDTLPSSGTLTWTDNLTLPGWHAQRTGNGTTIVADAGTGTGGNLYSYGAASTTDRALGTIGSGNAAAGHFAYGVLLQNTSGNSLSLGSLSYVGEQWRNGAAAAQTVTFWYQISTAVISNLTPNANAGWTAFSQFDFTSPITGGSAGALNGNLPANQVVISNTLGLTLQPNEYVMFRWSDPDHSGTDHGLAIDSFSLAWGAPVSTLYWDTNGITTGTGGTGDWDADTANWSTSPQGDLTPTTFVPASPVVFSGTAGSVTITGAGVTATGGIQVESGGYVIDGSSLTLNTTATVNTNHAAETLTTISAAILGNAGLTKTGTGTLELNGTNNFDGTVTLSGGVLRVSNATNLGKDTNALAFGGGKLAVTENVSLAIGQHLSGSAAIAVGSGKSFAVQGNTSVSSLNLEGAGTVALNGATRSVGAITFADAGTLASTAGAIAATTITASQPAATAIISADLDLGATTRVVSVADGAAAVDLELAGAIAISGGSNNRLHKLGAGTLWLGGDNINLSGSVRIGTAGATPAAGGTVIITNKNALGTGANLQVQFNDGVLRATTDLTGANAIPLGLSIGAGQGVPATFAGEDMEFTGTVNFFRAGGVDYVHSIRAENTTTFSGSFGLTASGNSNGFSLTGDGTLVLAGATNAVAEAIVVNGPTLAINGALTAVAASVTVQEGTLTGSGSIAGNVTLEDGAFLEPGDGLGTLTLGANLNLSAAIAAGSGALKFELDAIGASDSVVLTTGALTLGTNLDFADFDFTTMAGFGGGIYTLFATPVEVDGTFVPLAGFVGGFASTIELGDGGTDIVLNVVPEPGSAMLLLGGLGLMAARRRRS